MGSPMRWLAALATSGAAAGGAVALTPGTPASVAAARASASAPAVTSVPTTAASSNLAAADVNVQLLLDEANQLQTAITSARTTLAHSLSATLPTAPTAAATSVTSTRAPGSPASASLLKQSQQLAADEAAVATERQQLAAQA